MKDKYARADIEDLDERLREIEKELYYYVYCKKHRCNKKVWNFVKIKKFPKCSKCGL